MGSLDALNRLPAGRQFGTVGEIVRALGIRTEEPRDRGARLSGSESGHQPQGPVKKISRTSRAA